MIAASIFSSNIGSEHLVGLAGSGCTDGVAMAHYELHAWCLLVLAWVMIPFYARSLVYTMPEFLEKRFTPTARWVLSIISLVAYVLTKLAVGIFAGGVVFGVLLPELKWQITETVVLDSFWIGSVIVVLATGLYTVIGGLRAVAYTDTLQTIIFIVGSAMVTVYGLIALSGRPVGFWEEVPLYDRIVGVLVLAGLGLCAAFWKKRIARYALPPLLLAGLIVASSDLQLGPGRPAPGRVAEASGRVRLQGVQPLEAPGAGGKDGHMGPRQHRHGDRLLLRRQAPLPLAGNALLRPDRRPVVLVYGPVHRAACPRRPEREGRPPREHLRGLYEAAAGVYLHHPGDDLLRLGQDAAIPASPTWSQDGQPVAQPCQSAFPLMVKYVLPVGIRGLVVAGLLSALMSSLAGAFNASSTLFTMDLYQKFRPRATQHQLVWIGRIATTAMVLIALAWIPVIRGQEGLYKYLQSVQSYLAPPIFVVFFFGVFMKRLNGKGCLAALAVGFVLGLFRLAVDTPVLLASDELKDTVYAKGSFFWIINNIYFQYYSMFIFLVCVGVMIAVSYATKAPAPEQIQGLTYGTVTEEQKRKTRESWTWGDVIASAGVVAAILAAYLYFMG